MTEEIGPRAHGRTPETDEVLRRIGRNGVNFQQVEELLKYLNAHSRIKSPVSQLAAHVEGRAEAVHKKTMGLFRLVWVGRQPVGVATVRKPVVVAPQASRARSGASAAQCGQRGDEWGQAGGNSWHIAP